MDGSMLFSKLYGKNLLTSVRLLFSLHFGQKRYIQSTLQEYQEYMRYVYLLACARHECDDRSRDPVAQRVLGFQTPRSHRGLLSRERPNDVLARWKRPDHSTEAHLVVAISVHP